MTYIDIINRLISAGMSPNHAGQTARSLLGVVVSHFDIEDSSSRAWTSEDPRLPELIEDAIRLHQQTNGKSICDV